MKKLFKLIDHNKSGYIDRHDWIKFCLANYESQELQRLHDMILMCFKDKFDEDHREIDPALHKRRKSLFEAMTRDLELIFGKEEAERIASHKLKEMYPNYSASRSRQISVVHDGLYDANYTHSDMNDHLDEKDAVHVVAQRELRSKTQDLNTGSPPSTNI